LSLAFAKKVAIVNDLHFDPFFNPAASTQDDCRGPNPFDLLNIKDTAFAPYGRYGCDVSPTLTNLLLGKLKEVAGDVDIMLVSGDYTAHDISAKRGVKDSNFSMLKSVITACFAQYIDPLFPDTIIIPAIGNNDVEFHYEFPTTEEEAEHYYGFLFDLWWNTMGANKKYENKEKVRETLMKGGYFRYDHSKYVSFLAINSLYWSVKNAKYESKVSHEQLDWLEEQLRDAEHDKKFIINMHVFPGMYHPGERQQFWLDEFNNRFDDIMREQGDKVIMVNGAHTHIADIRASWVEENSTSVKGLLEGETIKKAYYANFVSPSFSPFYLNNPGFTVFDLHDEEHSIDNIKATFLQLDRTYENSDHELVYHEVDYEEEFGILEWTPEEVLDFMERAQNDDEFFKKYLVLKLGYRLDQEEEALAVYKNLKMIDFDNNNKIFWCFFQFVRSEDFDACVAQ
jgi:hypothetical protein